MARQSTLLVIEPDPALHTLIGRVLSAQGYRVLKAQRGDEALALWDAHDVDLAIVSQQLPDMPSLALCDLLREGSEAPLLLIGSAGGDIEAAVFDHGIDDYLVAPFHDLVLLSRVRVLLRRAQGQPSRPLPAAARCGDLLIDPRANRLLRRGAEVHLTRTEWALLKVFVQHHGQVLTHRMLLQHVWGKTYGDERSYLHAYIRRLRCKIEDDLANPRYIISESGIGYRFMPLEQDGSAGAAGGQSSGAGHAAGAAPAFKPLPAPQTALIGRDQELAAICGLLRQPDARLVTLLGVGGAGTTLLALHAAHQLAGEFAAGAVFVALDAISDAQLVPALIARQLGLQDDQEHDVAGRLEQTLKASELLLVLDNVEQLAGVAAIIRRLLDGAPGLKVLVTSRMALGMYGDHEFQVPPLGLPALQALPEPDQLTLLPSVQLFVRRAQAVAPAFALDARNAAAVAAICVRLDGLPLAIELAAVQSKLFTPQQILTRLEGRLQFLRGGGSDRAPRQQTLRGAIDWSYELLAPPLRRLLARLGVFVGRWTIEAAEQLCADQELEPGGVLEGLTALVAHNLIHLSQEEAGPALWMFESIREYARELLAGTDEAELLAERHAGYFLALAEEAAPALLAQEQERWLERLEQAHPNLRAALGWLMAAGRDEDALRLAGALWRFWWMCGHVSEGQRWLVQILERREGAAPAIAAEALDGAGVLTAIQGDYAQAELLFSEACVLYQQLDDQGGIARALNNLGNLAMFERKTEQALALFTAGLELFQALGDQQGMSRTYNSLGLLAQHQERYADARALFERGLELDEALGNTGNIAIARGNIGLAAVGMGNYAEGRALLTESLLFYQDHDTVWGVIDCLGGLAGVLAAQGQAAVAAQILGAYEAISERSNTNLLGDTPLYRTIFELIRSRLDPQVFADAWQAGRLLPLDAAVAAVLEAELA
ncbi:MAG TPA: winged helix-turn-helix domain-containing protein [Herpetosiphonaceae bacterium]